MFLNINVVANHLNMMKRQIDQLNGNLETYEKSVRLIDKWDDTLKEDINDCIRKLKKLIQTLMRNYLQVNKQATVLMNEYKNLYLKNTFKGGI